MKKIAAYFLLGSLFLTIQAGGPGPIEQIIVGTGLPMAKAKVKDISGATLQLQKVAGPNGLLVIFSCNTCPFVTGWEGRYPQIADYCKSNNIGMIVLNSNEAKRAGEDSFEAMVEHAGEQEYDFYYAMDSDHKIADAFGATKTPDIFLFDKKLSLVYKGAIDDNMKEPEMVEEHYLMNALKNMIAGKAIDPSVTKSIGCSIKRVVQ